MSVANVGKIAPGKHGNLAIFQCKAWKTTILEYNQLAGETFLIFIQLRKISYTVGYVFWGNIYLYFLIAICQQMK